MYTSFFDVFSIGIGPSSSHTMGPMRAAARFVRHLREQGLLAQTESVCVRLYGSLALTGEGHGTPGAVVYGLMGEEAESIDIGADYLGTVRRTERLILGGVKPIHFCMDDSVLLLKKESLPQHPNGMEFTASDAEGAPLLTERYFSIGGGAIRREDEMDRGPADPPEVPHPFSSCREMMEICAREKLTIAGLVLLNECALRPSPVVRHGVKRIALVMEESIERGIAASGSLPGPLHLVRRAPLIYHRLEDKFRHNDEDALVMIDWINLWAFAVSEENAAGGRVVTAPTMGSAGVMPSVLRYFNRYGYKDSPYTAQQGTGIMLLTAAAICNLYRTNASISGAEVGCQGEVGVACSMAAAGLTAAMGGSSAQIENAAEIAMEHNLGLTCDPICGLVQVPCIERNAIGAVKAVNAARLAMRGDGSHFVSLDSVIRTMYETGHALQAGYRETSLAGLAKNALTC
ncbi:MAG TPA: L-serine ammonia-lyase [Candidatus Akkermansia intestinigallinarum]|uniref:L-serine dehydratase n=1 Tax=Candidatus Akkermansia intestinigallinarum TaxID=2838431 RepID=A0A9D2AI20_9BACT|nr:L-serine ammonia-lyase [Candidatus Akkermansia intestinigallinarum]